jgi:hypothetical protein
MLKARHLITQWKTDIKECSCNKINQIFISMSTVLQVRACQSVVYYLWTLHSYHGKGLSVMSDIQTIRVRSAH